MAPRKKSAGPRNVVQNSLFEKFLATDVYPEDSPSGELSDTDTPPSELDGPVHWTVSEITDAIQVMIDDHPILGDVLVIKGELTNVKQSARGHMYFTLKDADAALSGKMWASTVARLKFEPEDGMEVFVTGRIEIYAPSGTYSITATKIDPVGEGPLQLAFRQIREKLEAEGLFLAEHKQPLPDFPERIGIVTSSTGAVIHDMLRVLRRKQPNVSVLLAPVKVQGDGAADEIAAAITELNRPEYDLDLLIVGRGGGSFEDLFCFNEEPVVRAIFASRLPVITGIGHEPDYSLADAVADYSAATPTMAAEYAVPDLNQLISDWNRTAERLVELMVSHLYLYEQRLDQIATTWVDHVSRLIDRESAKLASCGDALRHNAELMLQQKEQTVARIASELEALSPLSTLARGYCVATGVDGQVIRQAAQLQPDDELSIRWPDGSRTCRVVS